MDGPVAASAGRRVNPRYPEYHVLPGDPSPPRDLGVEAELARRTFRTVDSPKNVPGIPADSGGGPMMKTGIHDARGENGAWAMLMLVMCLQNLTPFDQESDHT